MTMLPQDVVISSTVAISAIPAVEKLFVRAPIGAIDAQSDAWFSNWQFELADDAWVREYYAFHRDTFSLEPSKVLSRLECEHGLEIRGLLRGGVGALTFAAMMGAQEVVVKMLHPSEADRCEIGARFVEQRGVGPAVLISDHEVLVMDRVIGPTLRYVESDIAIAFQAAKAFASFETIEQSKFAGRLGDWCGHGDKFLHDLQVNPFGWRVPAQTTRHAVRALTKLLSDEFVVRHSDEALGNAMISTNGGIVIIDATPQLSPACGAAGRFAVSLALDWGWSTERALTFVTQVWNVDPVMLECAYGVDLVSIYEYSLENGFARPWEDVNSRRCLEEIQWV